MIDNAKIIAAIQEMKCKDPVLGGELDKRLAQIRKEKWSGRDVPYPTALVLGTPTPYGEATENKAQGAAAAAYGVIGYPTYILIDRAGRVVGQFNPNDEGIKLLKQKLAENN